ncbi:hypothetical protein ARALYDRAFT_905966 [Arabidopsis lyrata subsp. lyrata]|uniref:NAC domain-containing protein n=1 Tax=Arabidopsis lyrata subsp. lyrata TaxID=81972 RepID=D7LND3_ARALL|nr:hypothetical protein ARALYDRAFT_905966 [Arabidopsis lyrata subsp. lyrata]
MEIPPRNKRKERSSPERQKQPPELQTQPPSHNPDPNNPSSSSSSVAENFSSSSTKPFIFPPGFKFVPTDQELILQNNKDSWLLKVPVHHVKIYESNPQQLSEKYEKGNYKEWFFMSERIMISKGGKRQKHGVSAGYWNPYRASKKINAGNGVIGYKTALDYYILGNNQTT